MNGMQRMNRDEQDPAVSAKKVKDVVAFGRKCAQCVFPNPTREGCPDRARLRAMARRDPSLALADLPISHVVRCSPCFQDYRRLRQMSVFVGGLQRGAISLLLAAVLVSAVLFVANRRSTPGESTLSKQTKPQAEPSHGRANPELVSPAAPVQIRIDLAVLSPTRGDETEGLQKTIRLPRRNLRIAFEMPLGLEAGEYQFQLKDSSGAVYFHTRAPGRITDGTTSVDVDVDLTRAPLGKATLMVLPPGLSWRSFSSVIE